MSAPAPAFPPAASVSQAPAKLILSGEHAVVYGRPGLALACRPLATAAVETEAHAGLRIALPDLGVERSWTPADAAARCAELLRRHRAFLEGALPIERVLDDPAALLLAACAAFFREVSLPMPERCRVTVTSAIPRNSGMGSSAAILVALLHAWGAHTARPLPLHDLARLAADVEQLAHGRSSGIDPALCAHGGTIRFVKDCPPTRIEGGVPGLWIVQTGRPLSGTGECVARVAAAHGAGGPWEAFEQVAERMKSAWTAGDAAGVAAAVRENHRLLVAIGVVPERVAAFIRAVEESGAAAKVCGAGAVRGAAAGAVLVCAAEAPDDLCRDWGYEWFPLDWEPRGVRSVSPGGAPVTR